MRERCFSDDYPGNPIGKYFESLLAYDFPTPKPVGQLILLTPGLEGGEQPTAENSKDIEPSMEFGHQYLDLLKEEIARFKGRE